ncbi:MAG TPA: type II secretion system protein [Telluria sp.]
MHAVSRRRALARGFTMIETLVALVILSITLALGIPAMSAWLLETKAGSASQFYVEGFQMAREAARSHNAASRIVLSENAENGQMDWQVDLCFPTASVPCNSDSGSWSTTSSAAGDDPAGAAGFKSVFRSAVALPDAAQMQPRLLPSGATDIYFRSTGWVDTAFSPRLSRIVLSPAVNSGAEFRTQAVVVTLAGIASKCDPEVAANDSRACPP